MLTAPSLNLAGPHAPSVNVPVRGSRTAAAGLAQAASARALAAFITDTQGLTFDQVAMASTAIPDNLLHLLETPQGWSLLSDLITTVAQVEPSPILPTQH